MAMTYTQLSNISSRVRQQLAQNQDQIEASKSAFAQVTASLTGMESTYAAWVTEIDTLSTANPSDAAISALKADKDRMVAEFNSTKTRANSLTTAVSGI